MQGRESLHRGHRGRWGKKTGEKERQPFVDNFSKFSIPSDFLSLMPSSTDYFVISYVSTSLPFSLWSAQLEVPSTRHLLITISRLVPLLSVSPTCCLLGCPLGPRALYSVLQDPAGSASCLPCQAPSTSSSPPP